MKTFMPFKYITLCLAFMLVTLSCKTKQPEVKDEPVQNILVSFYSIGTGTDSGAINAMNSLLKKYADKKQEIKYDVAHWGREGEVDYCLHLEGYSAEFYNDFLAELNTLMKDRQVHVTPNGGCPYKK